MKSIKQKILLSMVAVVVVGMVVSGVVSVFMSFRSSEMLMEHSMKGTVAVTADRIEQELTAYLNVAKMTGQLASLSDATISVSQKQQRVLEIAQEYNMADATLIDATGKGLFDGNDYSDREYFQRAMQGESYVATPIISRVTGKPIISVVAPVYDGGTVGNAIVGVVVFLPEENFLNDILASIDISDGNQSYMIDQDGNTIADSEDPTKVLNENVEELAKSDKSLVERAAHHAEMRAGKTGVGEFPHKDHNDVLSYAPIDGTDGWSLALAVPDTDFMGTVYTATVIVVIIIILVIIIGVIVAIRLASSIGKPIQLCTERIDELAKGNLTDAVTIVNTNDEIGRLTKSTAAIVENIRNVIGDMGYLLSEMASGNLDVRSRNYDYYIGDYKAMIESAREIARGVSSALSQIGAASNQVSAGSEQVSSGAQSLAQGATEQASAVEELSATISDISQESQNTAERAEIAKTRSNETGALVQASNDYINNLDSTMDGISVSSQEIGKIIATIENIAFQTNILALNAAVEAARAGQAGKGFAVVADEVRNLASKSDQAAKDTKQLIEKSIMAVDEGVEMMGKVKTNMAQVMESTGDAVSRMVEVADAVARQNEAIMQVTQGIDQISSVVQTNSATAEESAAASEELSGQAEMLKNLVASFKLRDDSAR